MVRLLLPKHSYQETRTVQIARQHLSQNFIAFAVATDRFCKLKWCPRRTLVSLIGDWFSWFRVSLATANRYLSSISRLTSHRRSSEHSSLFSMDSWQLLITSVNSVILSKASELCKVDKWILKIPSGYWTNYYHTNVFFFFIGVNESKQVWN